MSRAVEYKWTNAEGRSWHDGQFGPWEAGKTLSVENAEKGDACGKGIHPGRTAAHAISWGKFPGRLFKCRGLGDVLGGDETKRRYASVKVLCEIEKPSWVVETETFIESIKTVQFLRPRRPPLKAWRHHAARAAAWDAAWDAPWSAARAAAWDAAWSAARAAAARAAGLMALMAITSDIDFPNAAKHREHARDRWKLWTLGYGLACDVNGVLYTYDHP